MENKFLFEISKTLFLKYQKSFKDLVIVLPSRRSSVFFLKQLSKHISKPVWLPPVYSIDDFFFTITNLKNATNLELFMAFYKSYKKIIPKGHNLERSYNWSNMLLEDFNELDKSHISHREVFDYLADVKRIENWYLDVGAHKEEIQDYISFFKKLPQIYQTLVEKLLSDNLAYPGLTQRIIVENLQLINTWLEQNDKNKIIFIGLDALTVSQELIVDYLLKNNLCDIFWDADTYFMNDINQESGSFLRKYKTKWPKTLTNVNSDFLQKEKQINIIGATKSINQTKLLAQILNQRSYSPEKLQNTAIILPNENLLLSVLESIPSHIKDINVTMGYKLAYHPIVSLFNDIITLNINARLTDSAKNIKTPQYLKKDILRLLRNPYFKIILNSFQEGLDYKLIQLFKNIELNYIHYQDNNYSDNQKLHLFLKDIFSSPVQTGIDLNNLFKMVISKLLHLTQDKTPYTILDQECLYIIEEQVLLFANFLENIHEDVGLKLFSKLFQKVLRSVKLNLSGEPLRGIQIMGLLEARTIDFDEVFVLSANESDLPPNNNLNSFIPFDVKRKFNIRTGLDIDAIYASIFFNLIKRSHTTHIIYNQDTSSINSGERSRFINQLLYEVKLVANKKITINEHTKLDNFVLENKEPKLKARSKDDFIFQKLQLIAKNGFSPSTINLYNYCKKHFYFEKILGVSSKEDTENIIDHAMVGSITHRVLYNLYLPYIDICLDKSILNNIKSSFESELARAYTYYNISNIGIGKNLIAIQAIKTMVLNFIKKEEHLVSTGNSIIIKHLEYEISRQQITVSGLDNVNIYLKGNIDRIDIYNGMYRIIDYKTGSVYASDLNTVDMQDLALKPKVLQLLLYAWLFNKENADKNIKLLTGIINLRVHNFDFQPCKINKESYITGSLLVDFEKQLIKIFLDMFSPYQDFQHFEAEECRFCN